MRDNMVYIYTSMNGDAGRSIMGKEVISIFRICAYFSEGILLLPS